MDNIPKNKITEDELKQLENELKLLKTDILNFFTENKDINDKEFYEKLIDYSNEHKELRDVVKLIIFLSSNIETNNKSVRSKVYQILDKLLNYKEKTLIILKDQKYTIEELHKMVEELKKDSKPINASKKGFLDKLSDWVINNKFLTFVVGIMFLLGTMVVVHKIDETVYSDSVNLINKTAPKVVK